jgi:hypothetical protein
MPFGSSEAGEPVPLTRHLAVAALAASALLGVTATTASAAPATTQLFHGTAPQYNLAVNIALSNAARAGYTAGQCAVGDSEYSAGLWHVLLACTS